MNDEQRYEQGIKIRKDVLGDKHVNCSLNKLNDFNADFQNFISRVVWGEVWSRPGMPKHTRSLVSIAMLVALGREDELYMHLRACFNNGVTKDDIKELILHCSIYAGLPAANAAMHIAEDVFKELGISPEKREPPENAAPSEHAVPLQKQSHLKIVQRNRSTDA